MEETVRWSAAADVRHLQDRVLESAAEKEVLMNEPLFREHLEFIEIDGRLFAVIAYSTEDAVRQVRQALFSRTWGS